MAPSREHMAARIALSDMLEDLARWMHQDPGGEPGGLLQYVKPNIFSKHQSPINRAKVNPQHGTKCKRQTSGL